MATEKTRCSECGGRMEEGTVLDGRHGSVKSSSWVDGPLKVNWLGKLLNKKRLEISAWRCSACGYLKLYADKPASGSSWSY